MYRLSVKNRLKKPAEFGKVFNTGNKVYRKGVIMLGCKNGLTNPRLGFAVSKKNINKAFKRNEIKRISRECFRLLQNDLDNIDYVIMVNKTCLQQSKQELRAHLRSAFLSLTQRLA